MIILIAIILFAYMEAGIMTGVYMFLVTKEQPLDKNNNSVRNQLVKLSVAAGIVFPITLAILAAYALAERKKR